MATSVPKALPSGRFFMCDCQTAIQVFFDFLSVFVAAAAAIAGAALNERTHNKRDAAAKSEANTRACNVLHSAITENRDQLSILLSWARTAISRKGQFAQIRKLDILIPVNSLSESKHYIFQADSPLHHFLMPLNKAIASVDAAIKIYDQIISQSEPITVQYGPNPDLTALFPILAESIEKALKDLDFTAYNASGLTKHIEENP